jgi:hypothetical protein
LWAVQSDITIGTSITREALANTHFVLSYSRIAAPMIGAIFVTELHGAIGTLVELITRTHTENVGHVVSLELLGHVVSLELLHETGFHLQIFLALALFIFFVHLLSELLASCLERISRILVFTITAARTMPSAVVCAINLATAVWW